MLPTDTHFKYKDIRKLKVNNRKLYHVSTKQKKVGVTILISKYISEKKNITRAKSKNFITLKESISQENKQSQMYVELTELQNM